MLPEKWFIVRNKENHAVINKWSSNRRGSGHNTSLECRSYFFSDKSYTDAEESIIGYTEISFEQFKQYILGEHPINQVYEIY